MSRLESEPEKDARTDEELVGLIYGRYYSRVYRMAYGMAGTRGGAKGRAVDFVIDHVDHGCGHMNFSDWARYDSREAEDLLRAIARSVRNESMPLDSYTLLHPRAKLTREDVKAIDDWVNAELDRKRARRGK